MRTVQNEITKIGKPEQLYIARTYDTSDSTIAALIYMELFQLFAIIDVLNFHYREQFHRSVKD